MFANDPPELGVTGVHASAKCGCGPAQPRSRRNPMVPQEARFLCDVLNPALIIFRKRRCPEKYDTPGVGSMDRVHNLRYPRNHRRSFTATWRSDIFPLPEQTGSVPGKGSRSRAFILISSQNGLGTGSCEEETV
jgi:hypothetical protein